MAVGTILIDKLSVNGDIGCYEISSDHFNVNNFYMCVDKSKKIIKFFLTKDFSSNPIRIIDFNKDEPIGFIPGVPTRVFSIVLMQSIRIFKIDTFPDSLSYSA